MGVHAGLHSKDPSRHPLLRGWSLKILKGYAGHINTLVQETAFTGNSVHIDTEINLDTTDGWCAFNISSETDFIGNKIGEVWIEFFYTFPE